MSVLIVDDSQHSRLLLTAFLKGVGYRDVLAMASAREAFKHLGMDDLESNPAGSDLILMDITMPELDGIEACRRIKATPELHRATSTGSFVTRLMPRVLRYGNPALSNAYGLVMPNALLLEAI